MQLQEKESYLIKDKEGKVQRVWALNVTEKAYNLEVEPGYAIIRWIEREKFDKKYTVIEHIKPKAQTPVQVPPSPKSAKSPNPPPAKNPKAKA